MHAKLLQTPASIRCKKTARSSYLYLYGYKQPDDKNHPPLSIFISFICMDTNNQMILNHLGLSVNDKQIIRKVCLMSLSSFYIPIQLYILRYIHTYSYTRIHNKSPPYAFHYYFLHTSIISMHNCFVTTFIKNSHISENMKIWPCDFTNDTRWGNMEEPRTAPSEIFLSPLNMHCITLILQRPPKN